MDFVDLLQLALVVLKITGFIGYSWLAVFSPYIIETVFIIVLSIIRFYGKR